MLFLPFPLVTFGADSLARASLSLALAVVIKGPFAHSKDILSLGVYEALIDPSLDLTTERFPFWPWIQRLCFLVRKASTLFSGASGLLNWTF